MAWFKRKSKQEITPVDKVELALNPELEYKCVRPHRVFGVQEASPVAWSVDGKYMAFVAGNNAILIVEGSGDGDFKLYRTLIGHWKTVLHLNFHPALPLLATSGHEGLYIWDYKKGSIVTKINEEHDSRHAHESVVEVSKWLCGGNILVSGGKDSNIKFWDSLNGYRFVEALSSHKAPVLAFAYSSKTDTLCSAGRDAGVKVWDVKTLNDSWREKRRDDSSIKVVQSGALDGHRGDITALKFSSNGEILYSGARDNDIRVWYVPSFTLMRVIKKAHAGDVRDMHLLNKDQLLVSASMDGNVKLWELADQAVPKALVNRTNENNEELGEDFFGTAPELLGDKEEVKDKLVVSIPVHDRDCVSMAINPRAPFMATTTTYNTVRVWDIASLVKPKLANEFVGHSNSISEVKIIHNDKNILTSSEDYSANLYNLETMRRIKSFHSTGSIHSMCTNPSQTMVYVGGTDYTIRGFALDGDRDFRFQEIVNFDGHCGRVETMAVNPSGSMLVSGAHDFNMHIWKLKEDDKWGYRGDPVIRGYHDRPEAHDAHVQKVAFNQDGSQMASASADHTAIVWKAKSSSISETWQSSRETGHSSVVSAIGWGRQDTAGLLITGGWDHKVCIWNPNGKGRGSTDPIAVLHGHKGKISALDVTADGQFLLTASADCTVRLWLLHEPYHCMVRYVADTSEGTFNCISAGHELFITGSDHGMVSAWPLPIDRFAKHFKEEAEVRDLSATEKLGIADTPHLPVAPRGSRSPRRLSASRGGSDRGKSPSGGRSASSNRTSNSKGSSKKRGSKKPQTPRSPQGKRVSRSPRR